MPKKVFAKTILAILVVSSLAVNMPLAKSNPVPWPSIEMPYEYIYANLSVSSNSAYAKVHGVYPFRNLGYENISMYYPIPAYSSGIVAKIDGNDLYWWFAGKTYPTIIGDFPIINWTISPVPSSFNIEVNYEHWLVSDGENYTFLYAMGTWKDQHTYAEQTTAYVEVNIDIEMDVSETLQTEVYRIGYNASAGEWILIPATHTITKSNNRFTIDAIVKSELFCPITEDFLVRFRKIKTKTVYAPGNPLAVQDTIDSANCGDTVNILSGTYHKHLNIWKTLNVFGLGNVIIDGDGSGSVVSITGDNVNMSGITVRNSGRETSFMYGSGIYIGNEVYSCNINNNTITNTKWGISSRRGSFNKIEGNTITNSEVAIAFNESSCNTIVDNLILNNDYGIYLGSTNNSKIYHNNFINNTVQALIDKSFHTMWDGGYPCGGNHWSNYGGVDLTRGQYQNETGSDGIGDTAFAIDVNNQDLYPLMNAWTNTALKQILPYKTIASRGKPLSFNFLLENQGFDTQVFNVTVYCNLTAIMLPPNGEYYTVFTLAKKNSKVIALTWNTTNWEYGNYIITICAMSTTWEINSTDNIIELPILLSCVGDVDGTGTTNIFDIVKVVKQFGTFPKSLMWDPNCDINSDFKVDIFDIVPVVRSFGASVP